MVRYITQAIWFCLILWVKTELIAYDCADPDTELSRISLLDVESCTYPRSNSETVDKRIQLIQERQYAEVHVYTCMITIQQLIEHCGMHSHTSAVRGGLARYVHYVKIEACLEAHRFQRIDLTGIGAGIVSGLNLNGTTEISTTTAGHLEASGKCQGVRYTDNEITYEDVIVSAAITIRLHDYTALANVEEDRLNLRTGTVCPFSDKYCFDDMAGEVTWEVELSDRCQSRGIDVLYEGNATILTLNATSGKPVTQYVIVETHDTVVALQLTKPEVLCHQPSWRT